MSEFAGFARRSEQAESLRDKYLTSPDPAEQAPSPPPPPAAQETTDATEPAPARRRPRTGSPRPAPSAARDNAAPAAVSTSGPGPDEAAQSAGEQPKRRNTTFSLTPSLVSRIDAHAQALPAGALVVMAVQWAYSNGSLSELYTAPAQLPDDALFAPLEPTRRRVRRDEHTVVWNARLRPDDFSALDALFVRLGAPNRNDLVFHALDLYLHHLEHDHE